MLTFLACRVDFYITQTCSHNNRQLLIWMILQRTADYMFPPLPCWWYWYSSYLILTSVESRVTIFHFNVMVYLVTDGHLHARLWAGTAEENPPERTKDLEPRTFLLGDKSAEHCSTRQHTGQKYSETCQDVTTADGFAFMISHRLLQMTQRSVSRLGMWCCSMFYTLSLDGFRHVDVVKNEEVTWFKLNLHFTQARQNLTALAWWDKTPMWR